MALEGFKVGLTIIDVSELLNSIILNHKTHKAFAKIVVKKFKDLDQMNLVKDGFLTKSFLVCNFKYG